MVWAGHSSLWCETPHRCPSGALLKLFKHINICTRIRSQTHTHMHANRSQERTLQTRSLEGKRAGCCTHRWLGMGLLVYFCFWNQETRVWRDRYAHPQPQSLKRSCGGVAAVWQRCGVSSGPRGAWQQCGRGPHSMRMILGGSPGMEIFTLALIVEAFDWCTTCPNKLGHFTRTEVFGLSWIELDCPSKLGHLTCTVVSLASSGFSHARQCF